MKVFHPKASVAQKFRTLIFGVEDSLVSTVGLLSGIVVGGVSRREIFVTGVVLIFVEAFSMGVGSYLSEQSEAEYFANGKKVSSVSSFPSAVIMFFGYLLAGFIPLSPYLIAPVQYALPISVCGSLVSLFALGLWSGTITRIHLFRSGARMFLLGGCAILIGIAVGFFLK